MSTCELCGEKLANSVEGLKNHNKRFHGGITPHTTFIPSESLVKALPAPSGDGSTGKKGSGKVLPIRHTGKTVGRITQELEWGMGSAIFPDTRPVKF